MKVMSIFIDKGHLFRVKTTEKTHDIKVRGGGQAWQRLGD